MLNLGWMPEGKRSRPKRKGATRAIVKAKLTELAEDLDNHVTESRKHTVASVVTEYVDELERGGKAPSTIYKYRLWIKNKFKSIGKIKIKDLLPSHVSAWLVDLSAGLSTGTIRKLHALLTNSIKRAIVYEYVARNVSLLVARPKGSKSSLRESKSFSRRSGALDCGRGS